MIIPAWKNHCAALLLMILAGLFGVGGCGTEESDDPEPATSIFFPVAPPISSADQGGVFNASVNSTSNSSKSIQRSAQRVGTTPLPMTKWFYLVSGVNIEAVNRGKQNPYVLAVTTNTPNQKYLGPNSYYSMGIVESNSTAKPLTWKAVAAYPPDNSTFFLRSALSFTTDTDDYPNLLTGYGASLVALDMGVLDDENTPAIYMNQQNSTVGDNSLFQQWTYDNATGRLYSSKKVLPLTNQDSTPVVGNVNNDTLMTWYTYPNYYLSQVGSWPQSNPAFPYWLPTPLNSSVALQCSSYSGDNLSNSTATSDGQGAAYRTISKICAPDVRIGEACYDDIRCMYPDASSDAFSCSDSLLITPNPGTSSNGTAITDLDWQIMTCQIHLETYAVTNFINVYNAYQGVLNDIFTADTDLITSLATSTGLAKDQPMSTVPQVVMEGLAYTMLSEIPKAGGAMANLMAMGYDVAVAKNDESAKKLALSYATTASEMYGDLYNSMIFLWNSSVNGYDDIMEDWGKLKTVGSMVDNKGYNGLGSLTENTGGLVDSATKAYALYAMQQLLPAAFSLSTNPSQQGLSYLGSNCYDQWSQTYQRPTVYYSYETFPGHSVSNTISFLYSLQNSCTYANSTMLQNNIWNMGASPYEVYNALNGWNSLTNTDKYQTVLGCAGTVVTLFNESPYGLNVDLSPSQGLLAAPGYSYCSNPQSTLTVYGSDSAIGSTIPPYGYLSFWVTAYGGTDDNNLTMNISMSTVSGDYVGEFTFGGDGCHGKVPTYAMSSSTGSGWRLTFYNRNQGGTNGAQPAGLWVKIGN